MENIYPCHISWKVLFVMFHFLYLAVCGTAALQDFWEAGIIIFLFSIAQWLETRATHKVGDITFPFLIDSLLHFLTSVSLPT